MLVARPQWAARSMTAGILPPGADQTHAVLLARNLAIVGAGALLLLAALMLRQRELTRAHLGTWCLLASIGLYAALGASYWWYVNDDAGITFTYARNLAEGLGPVFNPGDSPVEGFSNPLWTYLLAGARYAGLDILVTAKTLGLVLGGICIVLVWVMVRNEHPLSWLALPLMAGNAALVIWFNSGLENALHSLLLILCVLALTEAVRQGRTNLMLLASVCLLVISRPEGAMFGFLAVFYLGWHLWYTKRSVRPAVITLAVFLAFLAVWSTMRYLQFNDLLPNTYYAKASASNPLRLFNPLSGGWRYVAEAAAGTGLIIALVPLLLLLARRAEWPPWVPAALLIVGGQIFFTITVGGDWMHEFRFISHVIPPLCALVGFGLAVLYRCTEGTHLSHGRALGVCLLTAFVIGLPQLARLIRFADRPTTSLDTVAAVGEYFNDLARQAGIEDPILLAHDAGGTSYIARIHLLDLAGLCDRVFAKEFRDRDRIRRYIFEEMRPTFIFSSRFFADRVGLESFEELETDYIALPPAPRQELHGYIQRVRRDVYPRIFPLAGTPSADRSSADRPTAEAGTP